METNKTINYELTLNDSEIRNMIRVCVDYLDNYEKESYEIDKYTLNNVYEMLALVDDNTLIKETKDKIDVIVARCDGR